MSNLTSPKASRQSGFTLIELLIVVAIIAILAAIAVPNFLEAQVRAKYTRFMADLRSAATAMESYMVDHSKYPPPDAVPAGSPNPFWHVPPVGAAEGFMSRRMTTPIAYLSKLPIDIFPNRDPDPDHPEKHAPHYVCDYYNVRWYASPVEHHQAGRTLLALKTGVVPPVGVYDSSVVYLFHSHGPDGDHDDFESPQGIPTEYDPTNGTISDGDIFYFGPGYGFTR